MSSTGQPFSKRLRQSLPGTPWSKWDDGEPVGWGVWWDVFRAWLLPYRTAQYFGFDEVTGRVGPWEWNAPDLWRAFRGR